jgi:hypothetical protein
MWRGGGEGVSKGVGEGRGVGGGGGGMGATSLLGNSLQYKGGVSFSCRSSACSWLTRASKPCRSARNASSSASKRSRNHAWLARAEGGSCVWSVQGITHGWHAQKEAVVCGAFKESRMVGTHRRRQMCVERSRNHAWLARADGGSCVRSVQGITHGRCARWNGTHTRRPQAARHSVKGGGAGSRDVRVGGVPYLGSWAASRGAGRHPHLCSLSPP